MYIYWLETQSKVEAVKNYQIAPTKEAAIHDAEQLFRDHNAGKLPIGWNADNEVFLEKVAHSYTVSDLRAILKALLPGSFGFSLYVLEAGHSLSHALNRPVGGLTDDDIPGRLVFPHSAIDHDMHFTVHQGGENTYFRFKIYDTHGNGYVGNFGFKDQGEVPTGYIRTFINWLLDQYSIPA